jgi:hypothetical protein
MLRKPHLTNVALALVMTAPLLSCRMQQVPLAGSAGDSTNRVSLIPLIVYPDQYDGKDVFVDGFLRQSNGIYRIYLSREMAERLIDSNSLELSLSGTPPQPPQLVPAKHESGVPNSLDDFQFKCVGVNGTFSKKGALHTIKTIMMHSAQSPQASGTSSDGDRGH